jgi:hypothetical protein
MKTKKEKLLDKIGELICDKTVGKIDCIWDKKDKAEFGSLVTLTYLQRKIFPILDELRKEV